MTLTELITSSNARGHIGVRGTFNVIPDKDTIPPTLENVLTKAEALDLIRLVSAWRSTEDDLVHPEYRGVYVDRRVYALTHKGWDFKINCRDTLSSYKASILAAALAAHYGELEEPEVGLRYPEEAFDEWEQNADPLGIHTARRHTYTAIDPPIVGEVVVNHQYPHGPMLIKVPDDHWIPPRRYEVFRWEALPGFGVILVVGALVVWWLS